MTVKNTNTPNGDSKNLYYKNIDKQEVTIVSVSELDPQKDATGKVNGDNTVVAESCIINNTNEFKETEYVTIGTTFIGQPEQGLDAKNKVKNDVNKYKNNLFTKNPNMMTSEEYIALKKQKLEEKELLEEAEKKENFK